MSCLLVPLVVCLSESNLVTRLLIDARRAGVSIFDVESAQEANFLVGVPFNRVRDIQNSCLRVLDHLGSTHVWHGNIVVSTVSASSSIVPTVSTSVVSRVLGHPNNRRTLHHADVGCTAGTADTVFAARMTGAAAWVACMSDTAVPTVQLFLGTLAGSSTPAKLLMVPGL